ncbi:MAG: hypothetical protein KY468_11845, partial [Armatimonadetes bacterium]|nr:hypothetical protein [Armatimonadota bacterium]
ILVVTQGHHMKRSLGVFRKIFGSQAEVVPSVAPELRFDEKNPKTALERLEAFRTWVHESAGYLVYKRRGWL